MVAHRWGGQMEDQGLGLGGSGAEHLWLNTALEGLAMQYSGVIQEATCMGTISV